MWCIFCNQRMSHRVLVTLFPRCMYPSSPNSSFIFYFWGWKRCPPCPSTPWTGRGWELQGNIRSRARDTALHCTHTRIHPPPPLCSGVARRKLYSFNSLIIMGTVQGANMLLSCPECSKRCAFLRFFLRIVVQDFITLFWRAVFYTKLLPDSHPVLVLSVYISIILLTFLWYTLNIFFLSFIFAS